MTQVTIPLDAVASQKVSLQLANQSCRIEVYQKRTGLYLNLFVNDAPVVYGVLCRDRIWIVRGSWQGFTGDLAFIDTQGRSDPDYTGLGARFVLVWEG